MRQGILANDCSGNLGLCVDPYSQRVVMGPIDSPSAQWRLTPGFNPHGVPMGIAIEHMQSGSYLVGYNGELACSPVKTNNFDGWSTWDVGTDVTRFKCLRLVADNDLNLSTGTCNPGMVPGLRGWDGGERYEVWNFSPNPQVPIVPVNYQISAQCGGVLTAQGTQVFAPYPVSTEVVAAGAGNQTWQVEVGYNPSTNVLLGGMAIISAASGLALAYASGGTACKLVPIGSLDLKSTWTFGFDDPNIPQVAVRPQWDTDQNLNVFGGCAPGMPTVGTWGWDGGSNENWSFNPPLGGS